MNKVVAPPLSGTGYAIIPILQVDASKTFAPAKSKPEFQQALNYPSDFNAGELVPDWQQRALTKLAELKSRSRALQVYLDGCVKCGACTD